MAETQTTRFRLPQWSQGTDPYPGRTGWNNILKLLEDQAAIAFPSGPISSRPGAGTFGRFFLATDQGTATAPASRLYYDGGSGWVELNTNGGGGPAKPIAIGGTAAEGTSNRSARADHVHTLPLASTSNAGALSAPHYDLLNGASTTTAAGMLVLRTGSGNVAVPTTPGGSNDATSRTYVLDATSDIREASGTVKPGALVRRGGDGGFLVPAPSHLSHPTPKTYVDNEVGTHLIQPGELVRRWSGNGTFHVPEPVAGSDVSSRRYVDSKVSRKEWKENPRPLPYGLDEVAALARKVLLYDYKDTEDTPTSVRGQKDQLGAYVEDVHQVMPLLTVEGEDGAPERITDRSLIWPALTAIAQLEEQGREKDTRIAALVSENAALNDRVHRIEGYLGL